jgi:hypothetical protein
MLVFLQPAFEKHVLFKGFLNNNNSFDAARQKFFEILERSKKKS